MSPPLTVMLVAAEASGDVLGAGLARALRDRLGPEVRFVGLGGPEMAGEGVESPFDFRELSVIGVVEALAAWPRVRRRVRDLVALARREQPDVAVLIDSWGFTVRVGQALRRALPQLALVKYVAPQVWASRPARARVLARSVDLLLSTVPMDLPFFEREGLATVFVGNRALAGPIPSEAPRAVAEARTLLMLPGSRSGEVRRLLPAYEQAADLLRTGRTDLRIVMPVASTVADQIRRAVADWSHPPDLAFTPEEKAQALRSATAAIVCSGTATTEVAMAGVPMVVTYRVSPLTLFIGKRLITTPYLTLLNIAAGQEIAPERLHDQATGPELAKAVAPFLDDPELRRRQVEAQFRALDRLGRGAPDPSGKAAETILALLRERGRL